MTTTTATRQSPMHEALEHLHPTWARVNGMNVAAHFGNPEQERQRARVLGVCDVTALPRMGLKGAGGAAWLSGQGVNVPEKIYGHGTLNGGGLILRAGTNEFFLEDGPGGDVVARLGPQVNRAPAPDVYPFFRQDAAMLLSGERAFDVLAQTCGYNFRQPEADLVFSRVAGVSCSILRQERDGVPLFRVWCDGSFGEYLFEQLLEISNDCGGGAVGMGCFYDVNAGA